jgi:hypothetical protein
VVANGGLVTPASQLAAKHTFTAKRKTLKMELPVELPVELPGLTTTSSRWWADEP